MKEGITPGTNHQQFFPSLFRILLVYFFCIFLFSIIFVYFFLHFSVQHTFCILFCIFLFSILLFCILSYYFISYNLFVSYLFPLSQSNLNFVDCSFSHYRNLVNNFAVYFDFLNALHNSVRI